MAELDGFLDSDSEEESSTQETNDNEDVDAEDIDNSDNENEDEEEDDDANEDDDMQITTAESLLAGIENQGDDESVDDIIHNTGKEEEEEDEDDNAEKLIDGIEEIEKNGYASNKILKAEDLFAKQAEQDKLDKKDLPTPFPTEATTLSFDLGHLCAYDPSSIDVDELFKGHKDYVKNIMKGDNNDGFTKMTQTEYEIRKLKEKYLYDMSRNNVQALVNKLYSLQQIKTGPNDDPGILVKLPAPRCKLPRSKPVPEEKPLTRWEKFAARKGIRTSKKTKDLLKWDENTQEWKKKYGYKKANNPMDAPLYEHKDNDFDLTDPWLKMEKAKKKRISINKENRMRNLQEALGDRIGGTLDLQSALNHSKNKKKRKLGNRAIREMGKVKKQKFGHLNVALGVAQHSTGSMGKFDKLNRNEPKPKLMKNRKKSVDYMQTNENTKIHQYRHGKNSFHGKEIKKQKEILFNIFGKQQTDAFNMDKATKHEQFQIEKRRAHKNRNRSRKRK